MKLEGTAFDDGLIQERAVCRFTMENGDQYCEQIIMCMFIKEIIILFQRYFTVYLLTL